MNKEEAEVKLNSIITHVEKTGVPGDEVKKYYDNEYITSLDIGMNEADSYMRALKSTFNFYKKKLDKMGNRITFLCLGASQPTDYGLSKKFKETRKLWLSADTSVKKELVEKGTINPAGMPLHTADTTLIEGKIGSPITLEEEYSQNLFGIVKQDGKTFPAIVRVYGQKECNTKKVMYIWSSISADQTPGKNHPNYITLVSRELGMLPVPGSTRITIDEYKEIVEKEPEFVKITFDISDHARLDALEVMVQEAGNKMGHTFIKNAWITGYSMFSANGGATSELLVNTGDMTNLNAPIVADLRIPEHIELDVDPATTEELWLLVLPREKKPQDKRMKFEVLGMFVNTPGDRSKFKMNDSFLSDDGQEKLITGPSLPVSSEMETLYKHITEMK